MKIAIAGTGCVGLSNGVLLANRISEKIKDVEEKIYTRDIFNSDS